MSGPTVETVCEKVEAAVATIDSRAFEPLCRGFAEDVYERMLNTVQDYLADNLTWNLRADFDYAAARARHYEEQVVEIDNLVTPFGGREDRLRRINELLAHEIELFELKARARSEHPSEGGR